MKKYSLLSLALMFVFTAGTAAAESWSALPVACLPERAAPWINGKTEAEQDACHCPPASLCPKTFEEYSDNSKAKMPVSFVRRCCPIIKAPEKCPNGKLKQDGVPCEEPKVLECPEKYYPNLNQSLITDGGKYNAKYLDDSGKTRKFSVVASWDNVRVDAVKDVFSWSLRLTNFAYWIHGSSFCKGSWYGNTICAGDGYAKLANGVNYSKSNFASIVSTFGAQELTWFGISIAPKVSLPDNLVSDEVMKKYANRQLSFIQIAENGYNAKAKKYQHVEVEKPDIGLFDAHKDFVKVCRSVAGEYATVEYYDREVKGETLSCPYLQCRYVYDSTMESCLEENTQITLADGAKKQIKDLKVGDLVMNGEGKSSKVKAVNRYQEELRVLYGINGGKPTFTGDHPIKTKAGWKMATEDAAKVMGGTDGFSDKPLAVGDVILGLDGNNIEVKSIERHPNFEPINTYNLKIEGDNSFVAADMVVKGFNKMEMHY